MRRFFKLGYMALIYALLYLPIIVLIIYSFNEAKFSMLWRGFSLQWYLELLNDSSLWDAFFHSIILGLTAAFIASVLGLLACIHLFIHRKKQGKQLFSMLLLLIIVPDIVMGVSLLVFFNVMHISLGFYTLLIAHITFCLPFTLLTISTHMRHLDINIYHSALDLGASRFKALTNIVIPILKPAILSAFLLAFTLSFDDVIISYFVAGPDFNILPLTIFSLVKEGVTPELNALCTLTFLVSMILVICSHQLSGKNR